MSRLALAATLALSCASLPCVALSGTPTLVLPDLTFPTPAPQPEVAPPGCERQMSCR